MSHYVKLFNLYAEACVYLYHGFSTHGAFQNFDFYSCCRIAHFWKCVGFFSLTDYIAILTQH